MITNNIQLLLINKYIQYIRISKEETNKINIINYFNKKKLFLYLF